MSLSNLSHQIDELGAATALIVLDAKATAFEAKKPTLTRGRLKRDTPAVNPDLLAELTGTFEKGWDGLRDVIGNVENANALLGSRIKTMLDEKSHTSKGARYYPHLGIIYGALNKMNLNNLLDKTGVKEIHHADVEMEVIKPVAGGSNVPQLSPTDIWGIKRMGAPELWSKGFTGKDVLIAHLDTGADSEHPALQGAIEDNTVVNLDGSGAHSANPYKDTQTHGTHTAGTLVGRSASQDMAIGMAPDARLASGTVIEQGDKIARFLDGIDWAVGLGARILNMSLGFKDRNPIFETLLQTLRQHEILPVVSIGNSGANNSMSPADYELALSVGATDDQDQVAQWSGSAKPGSTEKGPLLCAPGSLIVSSLSGGGYRRESGTSMAAPHVSGLAALLLDACPTASIDQLQQAIIGSCSNPKNVSPERIGAGIPDGLKALEILSGARV